MNDERWRWKVTGTLIYEDGDRVELSLDRSSDGSPVDLLTDLIALLDSQTTWELARCEIEVHDYRDETLPALTAEAAPGPNQSHARAPGQTHKENDA